jgi:hypothetical protein
MFGLSLTLRSTLKQLFPSAFVPNFVSAKKKLLALPDPHVGDDEPNSSKRRRLHKNATVAYVKTIDDLPKDQGSKLDDLADCYMQARAWMKEQEDWRLAIANRKTKAAERALLRKQLKSTKQRPNQAAPVETCAAANDKQTSNLDTPQDKLELVEVCASQTSQKSRKKKPSESRKVVKTRKPRRTATPNSSAQVSASHHHHQHEELQQPNNSLDTSALDHSALDQSDTTSLPAAVVDLTS